MTPEEAIAACEAINKAVMDAVLPGGVWAIALLCLAQIAASVEAIFILAWLLR